MSNSAHHSDQPDHGLAFPPTRWSLILQAGGEDRGPAELALESLCRIYWPPIYGYLRRTGYSHQDAEDYTQGFLLTVIENDTLLRADREKGRLRSFLLGSLKRFVSRSQRDAHRLKRGGGIRFVSIDAFDADQHYQATLVDDLSPEQLFDRMWVSTLVQAVLHDLAQEMTAAGRGDQYRALQPVLLEGTSEEGTNARLAKELNMSLGAVKVAVHRLRARYRDLLLKHISDTLASPDSLADEVQHLMQLAGRAG